MSLKRLLSLTLCFMMLFSLAEPGLSAVAFAEAASGTQVAEEVPQASAPAAPSPASTEAASTASPQPTATATPEITPEPEPAATPEPTAASTATPAADPTPAPEKTPAVFGADVFYTVTLAFPDEPDADYGLLKIALLMNEGDGERVVSTLEIKPDADGKARAQFPLNGLNASAAYRAATAEYAKTRLDFAYSTDWDAIVAQADGLVFFEKTTELSLAVTARLAPLPAERQAAPASKAAVTSLEASNYTLTLNLALNGGVPQNVPMAFTISEDPVSGAILCEPGAHGLGITSVSSSVTEGGRVVLTVRIATSAGDSSLVYTVIVDPATHGYVISEEATDGYITSLSGASGTFSSGNASASLTAMATTDYAFSVGWNDNRAASRPVPVLTLQAGGAAVFSPPDPVMEETSYNLTKYTYKGLPKYAGGAPIDYSVIQGKVDGYITTATTTGVLNTLETKLTIQKQWYDASTGELTRPSADDWMNYLSLKRQTRGASDADDVILSGAMLDDTGDLWTLTVGGLPAYDEMGLPLDYFVVESKVPAKDAGLGEYVQTVKNVGAHAEKTAAGTAYDGGTLINTITDSVGFKFNKIWKDDGDVLKRPKVTFYLYRYPANSGLDFNALSPVKGHDNMLLGSYETEAEVVYAMDDALPRYDALGNEYVYYIREIMENPGDYQTEIENIAEPATTSFILPGAQVTNIQKATTSVPFTKEWHAKAVQSMNGGIAVALERKLAIEDDSKWEQIDTKTVTGFRTEAMTLTDAFGAMPKYDDKGRAYQYRVHETGATLNIAEEGFENNIVGGQFSSGGYDFVVTQSEDGTNTIKNRLVGTTQLRVKKVWSPALSEGTSSSIQIKILQDDLDSWDASGITLPAGAAPVSGAVFTLSGTGDLDALFSNLPKYDHEGREYVYTVEELAVLMPNDYSLQDITYSLDENNVKTSKILNVRGDGGPLRFDVRKNWLDDGDLLRRVPITMGLFYKDEAEPVQTVVLDASGSWRDRIYYTPTDGRSSIYDDYYIRELAGGGLTFDDYTAYLPDGKGYARTASMRYEVTTQKNSSFSYTVTNRRVGSLTITVNKQWAIADLTGKPLEAHFDLYREDMDGIVDSKRVALSGTPGAVFENLEKYDKNGVFIRYSVVEAGVYGLSGPDVLTEFKNGSIEIAPGEYIYASTSAGPYRYGATLDDPDRRDYTIKNSLGGSGDLSINKVWRDPGTGVPRRPDIRLSLYRYVGDHSGASELVATMRFWNTAIQSNAWYWTCGFGTYPKFDESGNRYHYYVKETILQTSEYEVSYFSDIDGTLPQPDADGTTTKETFEKQGGEVGASGFAYASFDKNETGTIINTLKGTRNVQAKKLWLNLPAWFGVADVPAVNLQLFRATEEITAATVGEPVQKDGANWIETLANGNTTATFADVPTYDEYGNRYYYYVDELSESGPLTDAYITTNNKADGTVTNTYNLNAPAVSINVTKTWDWSANTDGQPNYPDVVFELHQTWSNAARSRDVVINTATLPGGAIADFDAAKGTYLFTKDVNGANLLKYAPDGQAYGYYVVEKPVAGYTVSPADRKSEITWDFDHKVGQAAFTNTYTPEAEEKILATKVWADQNDAFGTRPAFDKTPFPITFTLKRKVGSVVDTLFSTSSATWTKGTDADENKWFAEFAGSFPKYATTGQAFTYYVEEALQEPYLTHYRLSAGSGTLQLTNTLNTVNVLAKKFWQSTEDVRFTEAELAHLKNLGVLPSEVTFEVFASEDGGSTYATNMHRSKTVAWADLLSAHLNDRLIPITQALPMYVPQTTLLRKYWTEEALMKIGGADVPLSASGFVADNPKPTSDTVSEIRNKLEVRKLYFVKNWEDEHNRDGVRPGSIVYTVTRKFDGSADTSTTVTLTPSTASSDPSSDAAHVSKADRWRAELTVPAAGTYTVQEAVPGTGYVENELARATATDTKGRDNWWSFTNERDKKLISVSATKKWAGEGDWVSITRPANVTVRLEYREGASGGWTNLSALTVQPDPGIPVGSDAVKTIAPDGSGGWTAAAVWSGLPAYRAKNIWSDSTVPFQYRIVETTPNGYSVAYSPAQIAGNSASSSSVNNIQITNTLLTVSITGSKTWNDQSNKYKTRPVKMDLTVLADNIVMSPQPAITWTSTSGDRWTYTINGLPKHRKGSADLVSYTVQETPVADYTPSAIVTAGDFTNTLITVSITGSKTWIDQSNKYATRPENIQLTVYANGAALASQPTINWTKPVGSDVWTYSITGLPKYEKGTTTPIAYTVVETAVKGYAPNTNTTVTGSVDDVTRNVSGANFTNTLVTVDISGSKIWVDDSDHFKMRPEKITLTVLADGNPLSSPPVIAWEKNGNVWTYRIEGLPRYQANSTTEVQYSVRETAVAGYTPATNTTVTGTPDTAGNITGADFTNTLATITIRGAKTWDDQGNKYLRRPTEIALTVLANGNPLSPQPVITWTKNGDTWSYVTAVVPRYQKGTTTPITYTVRETKIGNYILPANASGSVNGTTGNVTNANFTNTLETISITGAKTWTDQNNKYKTRPDAITLTVYADGIAMVDQPVVEWVKTANPWTYSITGLPKYHMDGTTQIIYAAKEQAVAGYTHVPTGLVTGVVNGTTGHVTAANFTNTLVTVSISGSKTWEDQSDKYGARPDKIVLTVFADGTALSPQPDINWTMPSDDDIWTYTITGLPRYQSGTTKDIDYTIVETAVPGYALGTDDPVTGEVDADTRNVTKADFTNTLATVSIAGSKTWEDQSDKYGTRPDEIDLTVFADGTALSPQPDINWTMPSDDDIWTYTITGLPRYQSGTTTNIDYTVVETTVPGYALGTDNPVTGEVDADTRNVTKADFTNSLVTVSIAGSKTWEDQSDKYGTRPDEIDLTVFADGTKLSPQPDINWTMPSDDDIWTYTITGLPRYQSGTTTNIDYTVIETAVPGYAPETDTLTAGEVDATTRNVTKADFTNALMTVSIAGSKTWEDQSDKYGARPDKIVLTVLADGTALSPQPDINWTMPSDDDIWTYTITGLPRYQSGTTKDIDYTVVETAVPGYAPETDTLTAGEVDTTTRNVTEADFTNTLVTVSISGSKTWEDQSDKYGTRPDKIVLTVFADGTALSPQPHIIWTKHGDTWTYTITGLPRYQSGTTINIDYTVTETVSPGYAAAVDTVTGTVDASTRDVTKADFTNTLVTVSISGSKTWEDLSNKYGTRPDDIILTVLADGTELSPQPHISWIKTSDIWMYTITGLPRYQSGTTTDIDYTVIETAIPGYVLGTDDPVTGEVDASTRDVTKADFTNTLVTVSISGSKTWEDQSNKFDMRPDDITLTVFADGTELSSQPHISWIKTSDTWTYTITGLPRYQSGTTTDIDYTIVEAAINGYALGTDDPVAGEVDASTRDVTEADFTNTLVTVSISGSKTWEDQSDKYGTRPDDIILTVLADGTELSPQPDIVWTKLGDTWMYTITGLPRYQSGTTTDIDYTVVETAVPGYAPESDTLVTGEVDASTRNVTEADFTNILVTVSISGSKTWEDQSDKYGTRPDAITLTVLADGTNLSPQPDIVWTKHGDTWTYTITGLPRYQSGTTTDIDYTIVETAIPGYALGTDDPVAGEVDASTRNVTEADFTNALVTVSISGSKTWEDQSDMYGTRPNKIILTVFADGTELSPQPDIVWTKHGDTWTYTITGLPRYQSGTTMDIDYTVVETAVPGYAPESDIPVTGEVDADTHNVTEADFTNSLVAVSIFGSKTWEDQSNKYGTRPDDITLTVLADGTILSPQPDISWTKLGDTWTYAITGLPRYQSGTTTDIDYTVIEIASPDYAATADTVTGTVDASTRNVTKADFTNTLVSISITGTKAWDDRSNRHGVRPENIVLMVLKDGAALSPQPAVNWTKTGDSWAYEITGLPRYLKGTETPIVYTVRETPVNYYHPEDDQYGKMDAATGNVTQTDLLNKLINRLLIDNITLNPATGETNAGGFVVVNGTPVHRDMDPYQDDQTLVRWIADQYWQHKETFTVRYLEYGAPEGSGWKSVTVSPDDLSALKAIPYFADAVLTKDGDSITLRLAGHYTDMPYLTQVLVGFEPTLAVENTTRRDAGGQVQIVKESKVSDGRYPKTQVQGKAKAGYIVDMNNLQISIPAGVSGSVRENTNALKIKPKNGRFSTTVSLEIAGVMQNFIITGQVKVLKRDSAGNPIRISITLDNLPAPLDIGIPFIPTPDDSRIPKTSDPLPWMIGLFLVSGLGVVTLRRKKKRP